MFGNLLCLSCLRAVLLCTKLGAWLGGSLDGRRAEPPNIRNNEEGFKLVAGVVDCRLICDLGKPSGLPPVLILRFELGGGICLEPALPVDHVFMVEFLESL